MKDPTFKTFTNPLKEIERSQQELEKRIFHLKTLYDLSQEIGYLRDPDEITRNLLLMMIGNFGASCGFIFLFDPSRGKMYTYSQRGLSKESIDIFSEKIESGKLTWLSNITQIEILDESHTTQMKGRKKLIDLLSSLSLRIWVTFNIDSNLTGAIGLGDKLSGDSYSSDDQELLVTMAHQGAVAIENAKLQQARIEALEQSKKELEKLNIVKSRALDHLSHELRTPLSVIQGNIHLIRRKTQSQTPPLVKEEYYESLARNLNRLFDIQNETDQIIRSYRELETGAKIEKNNTKEGIFAESILLYPLTERILDEAREKFAHRDLQIQFDGAHDLRLNIDPGVFEESLGGLLKNAIENTPDEGLIRIVLEKKNQWIQLKMVDFGIGITKENQRHLFDGLFHTLDTELYTSKKPYDFGAGGKGLDLLRVKAYSQRFGFDISVASQFCLYLPTDHDLCPGKISECPHCKVRKDCFNSGGSTFCLTFSALGEKDI